jgi:hypothetical protein
MVESGAKQFKHRFISPGMWWSRAGAERLLPIRAAVMSQTFHDAWRAIYCSFSFHPAPAKRVTL